MLALIEHLRIGPVGFMIIMAVGLDRKGLVTSFMKAFAIRYFYKYEQRKAVNFSVLQSSERRRSDVLAVDQ